MLINKDDGTGEAAAFAKAVNIPVLAAIPQDEDIRRKSANYQIVGDPEGQWGPMFSDLAQNMMTSTPRQPTPLDQDGLLGLFTASETGADWVLEPAQPEDMCDPSIITKESLEVVYDKV